MAGILLSDFLGRRIDFLGSNQNVDLGASNQTFKIFTTGTIRNRAPQNRTYVAFVVMTPNGPLSTWNGGQFDIDQTNNWAVPNFNTSSMQIPAVFFPRVTGVSDRPGMYPNGFDFNMKIVTPSIDGMVTVTAYGWAE